MGDDLLTEKITFGDCLKLLLSALDISSSRLSKAINVDSSLVNRWINGKRVPPYSSNHIDNISEFLSRNVYNTVQKQQIDSIFADVCKSNEESDNIKEKIKKILLEAQGYSIECNKKMNKEKITIDNPDAFLDLSSEDKVIYGTDNIFTTYINLINLAANEKSKKCNSIYITYNNLMFSEHLSYNDLSEWVKSLHEAISNGWNVIILIRSLDSLVLTERFINSIISLVITGKLMIYYIKNYDNITIGDGLVVIPDIGVLSCFTDNSQPTINCGLYIRSKHAITIYQKHFQGIIDKYAQPIVNIFTNNSDFDLHLTESEDDIGNRFLYKNSFSIVTLPQHLYRKILDSKNYNTDYKVRSLDHYKKRLAAFVSNIRNYEYRDVYLSSSIKDLVRNRKFYLYSPEGIETITLDNQDLIEYLENVINILIKNDNYYIAFLPKNYHYNIDMDNFSCLIKERNAIFLEADSHFTGKRKVQISITEPALVKAVYNYFTKLWKLIPPENREKAEVISWLRHQVDILKH